jgi:hypothetical protein
MSHGGQRWNPRQRGLKSYLRKDWCNGGVPMKTTLSPEPVRPFTMGVLRDGTVANPGRMNQHT